MRRPSPRLSAGVVTALLCGATALSQLVSGPAGHADVAAVAKVPSTPTTATAVSPATAARVAAATTATRAAASVPQVVPAPDATLASAIRSRMARSTSHVYGVVVDVDGVGRVVDINGGTSLLPASTEKLFTTLPLLEQRSGQRLVTTVGAAGAPAAGVLHGDLVIRASGDPTMMGAGLIDLARQVRAHGIRRVTGRLVLNIGSLPIAPTRLGWKSSYVPGDIGPLSPFPVHYDTWRTAASYVAHPTTGNLLLFRSKLAAAGVHVVGGNVVARSGSTATVFAQHSSATLGATVAHTLRWSDNFYAEQLLNVGGGLAPVVSAASAAGAGGSATDGSGLSLRDRRTARGEVALLHAAGRGPAAASLLASLPVACKSGTLLHEMCNTSAAGKVFAKTGTLDHVKALAGYTTDARGRLVTFAFLTSGDVNTSTAMNAIERSMIVLRHYAG